jgi:monofunctional biosynthetic peptidoglycan transglycosylase
VAAAPAFTFAEATDQILKTRGACFLYFPSTRRYRTVGAMTRATAPHWRRRLGIGLLVVVLTPLVLALVGRFLPVPITPLMVLRLIEGEGLEHRWVPLAAIAPDLRRAVMTSEDQRFCQHHGFDWVEIDNVLDRGGRMRGASTISQQTAKNVFLWPGRSYLRKGLEAGLTILIEAFWGKRRIMEVYLNVIEWGHGIYGAEAAARHYFHRPAADLTRHQAALLAAVLPNPRRFLADNPSSYVAGRTRLIEGRMTGTPATLCP